MEPSKQGVPTNPSSSQQQPQPYTPPTTQPRPQLAVRHPQPTQHAVQRSQPPSLPQPQPPLPPPPPPPMVEGVLPYLPLVYPEFYGHIPSSINASHYGAVTPRFYSHNSSMGQSSSTTSFGVTEGQASATGPHVGATDHFSFWSDNAILNPHASAFPSADQVDPGAPSPAPAIPRQLTPEEEQILQHVRHLVPGGVEHVGASACVVRLLKEGCQVIRSIAISAVTDSLHVVMGSSEWRCVFVELLRPGRYHELEVLVHAACDCRFSLVRVADNECGLTSLKDLFNAVKVHTQLRQRLINCLLNENEGEGLDLFEHEKGPDLLRSIFTTFPYEDSSCAIDGFSGVVSSSVGWESIAECFAVAKNSDLHRLEEAIWNSTVEIAKGRHSNRLLQEVLERGSDQFKDNITDVVVDHLVSLSSHRYGYHVVQACFLRTGSRRLPLLRIVLTKFQGLTDEELAGLVQVPSATCVVCQLLKAGINDFRDETMLLARRIQSLPEAVQTGPVRKMMEVVREVLS